MPSLIQCLYAVTDSVCLPQFVRAIGLDSRPFHLVGISMGGAISQNYAVHYPQDVALLTLICPASKLTSCC